MDGSGKWYDSVGGNLKLRRREFITWNLAKFVESEWSNRSGSEQNIPKGFHMCQSMEIIQCPEGWTDAVVEPLQSKVCKDWIQS